MLAHSNVDQARTDADAEFEIAEAELKGAYELALIEIDTSQQRNRLEHINWV